jgi:hypothetical protein
MSAGMGVDAPQLVRVTGEDERQREPRCPARDGGLDD